MDIRQKAGPGGKGKIWDKGGQRWVRGKVGDKRDEEETRGGGEDKGRLRRTKGEGGILEKGEWRIYGI